MSIERIYHCDGPHNPQAPLEHEPDRCGAHVRTMTPPPYLPAGFIRIQQGTPGRDPAADELHFCSWDCVLRYAGNMPPVEYIGVGEP